jgi:subtilase family serine protease
VSGTSFAIPLSAGTFSKILLELRRATGHTGGIRPTGVRRPLMVERQRSSGGPSGVGLTNWDLRRDLEEAAYYPALADYDPEANFTGDLTAVPINDVAPWAQAGWGAITPDPAHRVVAKALAHSGIRGFGSPTRFKSQLTCDFMTLNIEARHAYWDTAPFSQSFGKTADSYVYC